MAADLRERVARAIYEHACIPGDFIWELLDEQARDHWRAYADAVLAELGLTQAEPVAWSLSRFICDDDGRAIGTDETEVRWQSECPDADEGWAPLYAAPQPQADALKDALSSLDFYKRRCELLQECQKHMRDGERTLVCDILANGQLMGPPDGPRYAPQPQPQASAEDVALVAGAVIAHVARYPGSKAEEALDRLRASLGVSRA